MNPKISDDRVKYDFPVISLTSVTEAESHGIKELTIQRLKEFGFHSVSNFDNDLDNLQREYIDTGGAIFVAKDGNRIIGSLLVKKLADGIGEIKRFQNLPEYRGKGIGKKLLDSALVFMQTHGFKKAALDTTSKSTKAIELFKKAGFIETKREREKIYFEKSFNA
ncbi:MAG: GNAT family N-acetyltransferase [bacterium]|nr:GNAT family N-acetyltransferase [bacterium]